jgi:hypothetical protein
MRIPPRLRSIVIAASLLASAGCTAHGSLASSSGVGSAVLPSTILQAGGLGTLTPRNHVLTWLTIGEPGGTYKVDPTQVAQWVDYTMTTPALSVVAHAVGMKTLIYTDPNRVNSHSLMWTNDESTFAHDCKGKRITVAGSNDDLMNVRSHHLWALWPATTKIMEGWGGGGIFDYVFEDSADEINTQRLSALPCHFYQTAWTNDTNTMDTDLGMTIVYNGLGLVLHGQNTPGEAFKLNPTTSGGMSEDCYVGRTPSGYYYAPHWAATENTEIGMQQAGRIFICHGDLYTPASSSDAARTYFYASILLTLDLNTTIANTEFTASSGVTVMPEVQLVPEQPLVQTPSSVDALLQPSGVYGREYAACYLAGASIGPCAVAINPNNPSKGPPLAFPWPTKYQHTLSMSGSGVYDGGTVSLNGPAPPANMPGGTAAIVFP